MARLKPFLLLGGSLFILAMLTACKSNQASAATQENQTGLGTVDPEHSVFEIDFLNTDMLRGVLRQAQEEDKMIYIDFYATWCLPCKLMEEQVYTDPEIGNFINTHFLSMKVDAEKGNGPRLATLLQVNSFPTLLFLTDKGKVIIRKEGAAMQTEFRDLAQQAVDSRSPVLSE